MTDQITDIIREQVATALGDVINERVNEHVQRLVQDPVQRSHIEEQVIRHLTTRFAQQLSHVDVSNLVVEHIEDALKKWRDLFMDSFESRGIADQASSRQITVTDEVTVFNNAVSSVMLSVEQDADVAGTLVVDNLVIKNAVNTDAKAWQELSQTISQDTLAKITGEWKQTLVHEVLAVAKKSGIDFEQINLQGHPLVLGDRLNPSITVTNIQKLGVLQALRVSGDTALSDTLHVKNKRVGINTQDPDRALTIWDEEVSISMGKTSKDTAFVGTSRQQNLTLGVNRRAVVVIDTDDLVTMPRIRLDRWQIQFSATVPGWGGTRGDFVLNSDPKPNTPFAWVCLGGTRWQSIKGLVE